MRCWRGGGWSTVAHSNRCFSSIFSRGGWVGGWVGWWVGGLPTLRPLGGMSHIEALMALGIHSTKEAEFLLVMSATWLEGVGGWVGGWVGEVEEEKAV